MARLTDHGPFPFLSAAAETFEFFRANFRMFVVASWAWILLGSAAFIGWVYGLLWFMDFDRGFAASTAKWTPQFRWLMLSFSPILVQMFGLAAIAVTWHRLFILNERPHGLIPFHPKPVAIYVGRTLLLLGTLMLLLMLFGFVLMGIVGSILLSPVFSFAAQLVPFAIIFLGVFAMLRSGLAMPAAAVSDPKWTLERSWHETDGNGLRLVGGMLIVALPVYIGNMVIASLMDNAGGFANSLSFIAMSLVSNSFAAIGAAITSGYYSRAYLFFTAGDAMDRSPASHFT